ATVASHTHPSVFCRCDHEISSPASERRAFWSKMLGLSLHLLLCQNTLSFKLFNTWLLTLGGVFLQKVLQRLFCPSICRSCCHFSLRLIFNPGAIFNSCHMLHELLSGHLVLSLTMDKRGVCNPAMWNRRVFRGLVDHFTLTAFTLHRHLVPSLLPCISF